MQHAPERRAPRHHRSRWIDTSPSADIPGVVGDMATSTMPGKFLACLSGLEQHRKAVDDQERYIKLQSPTVPSTRSRIRSACPLCLAYSSTMCW